MQLLFRVLFPGPWISACIYDILPCMPELYFDFIKTNLLCIKLKENVFSKWKVEIHECLECFFIKKNLKSKHQNNYPKQSSIDTRVSLSQLKTCSWLYRVARTYPSNAIKLINNETIHQ